MSCPTPFELMVFADGEQPPNGALEIAAHVETCPRCRGEVAALVEESRVLSTAVAGVVDGRAREPVMSWLTAAAAGLLVVSAGSLLMSQIIGRTPAPGPGVAEGFARALLGELFFRGVFFLRDHGATMLTQWATMSLMLVLCAVMAIAIWRRRRALQPTGLMIGALLLFAAFPAQAAGKEGSTFRVAAGELVDESLVASGQAVQLDGRVEGDVLAFAQKVAVRGSVNGNLVTFAQAVEIEGEVQGTVVAFCQTAVVRGRIGANLYVFAETVVVDQDAEVGRDVWPFAEDVTVEGRVGRDLRVAAAGTEVRGAVGRDLRGQAARVELGASASIGRNLTLDAPSEDAVRIADGASIAGETTITEKPIEAAPDRGAELLDPGFYMWKLAMLVGGLIVGLLLFRVRPSVFRRPPAEAGPVAKLFGVGLLALVVVPVGALIALITVVGMPLAGIAACLWLVALSLSGVITAGVAGRLILRSESESLGGRAAALAVGLLVMTVATEIPFVGGWVWFLSLLFGLGVLTLEMTTALGRSDSPAI